MCQSDTVNTHNIPIYVVCCICRNLRAFWGDQTDPKSAAGGPPQDLRTGIVLTVGISLLYPGSKFRIAIIFIFLPDCDVDDDGGVWEKCLQGRDMTVP